MNVFGFNYGEAIGALFNIGMWGMLLGFTWGLMKFLMIDIWWRNP